MEMRDGRSGVVQVAYLTDDVRSAALRHSAAFGSGPFFVADHIQLESVLHHGRPGEFDHSSSYGQWGQVMVEFVSLHAVAPASLARAVGFGRGGIHHVARFVTDLDAEAAGLERSGHHQVLMARTRSGQRFAFHDGGSLGHLLEIYEPTPGMTAFYARVAAAAEDWNGADPLRPM